MHVEPGRSWTELTLDRRFEGWEGMAHGGILCTILDEVMAWALVGADNWGVTARMSVDFRKPVEIGRADPRRRLDHHARAGASSTRPAGSSMPGTATVLAESHGRYVAASEARKRELAAAYGFRVVGRRRRHTRPRTTADAVPTPESSAERPRPARSPPAPSPSSRPTSPRPRRSAQPWPSSPRTRTRSPTPCGAGLRRLADPEYREGQQRVAPGIGAGHRRPLAADGRRRRAASARRRKGDRATPLLFVADRLFRETELEPRWFAFGLLERTLDTETERTWQLLRRAAREAGDWITVDSLAHPYGKGIAAEPYRWAELEQLVYSPSRWERRLVGSTIATMTHVDRRRGRDPEVAVHALPLLAQLMGDAEPDVQKALSWAYRSLTVVDMPGTVAALRARDRHRRRARTTATAPGSSAIRLAKLDPAVADELRDAPRRDPPARRRPVHLRSRPRRHPLRRPARPAIHPEPPLA